MPDSFAASLRLAPDALTRPFEPHQFNFKTTDDLERLTGRKPMSLAELLRSG